MSRQKLLWCSWGADVHVPDLVLKVDIAAVVLNFLFRFLANCCSTEGALFSAKEREDAFSAHGSAQLAQY